MHVGMTAVPFKVLAALGGEEGGGIFMTVALLRRLCFIFTGCVADFSISFSGGERVSIDPDLFLLADLNVWILRLEGLGETLVFVLFGGGSASTDSTE